MSYLEGLKRQQQRAYDDVLAQEGMSPLDSKGGMVSRRGAPDLPARHGPVQESGIGARAVDEYLGWARDVLATCPFELRAPGSPGPSTRKLVWEWHAQGLSVRAVALRVCIAARNVRRAIALTIQEAGPPPVVNPWRKSGRLAAEAKLKEAAAMEPATKRRTVEYSRVILRGEVNIPGVVLRKSELVPMRGHNGIKLPLMGTPHAGGIDFDLATEHVIAGKKVKTMTTITVPWTNIQQADQAPEEVEAA